MASAVDEVDRVLSGVTRAAGERLFEITHEIRQLLTADIPELPGDDTIEKLLDASVEENAPPCAAAALDAALPR